MRTVEIRLQSGELSREMAAMRTWLDEHRVESSSFTCRDNDCGVLICVEFKAADQAEAFAGRFGGRANDPLPAHAEEELRREILETGVSPQGVVG